MRIIELKAENFRNIENEKIEFSPDVNLIWGNNAEGKTNIVEAIYYFANSKLYPPFAPIVSTTSPFKSVR